MSATTMGWSLMGWRFGGANDDDTVPRADRRVRTVEAIVRPVSPDTTDRRHVTVRDNELMVRIGAGDHAAFAQLMQLYASHLYQVAQLQTGNEFDAAEVVQDVFVAVWHGRASHHVQGDVRGYLFRAVYNRASNARRSQRAQHRLRTHVADAQARAEPMTVNDGETAVLEHELRQVVHAALLTLPPRAREIYLLCHEHELSAADIAGLIGVGVATVQNQLSRARQAVVAAVRQWQMSETS